MYIKKRGSQQKKKTNKIFFLAVHQKCSRNETRFLRAWRKKMKQTNRRLFIGNNNNNNNKDRKKKKNKSMYILQKNN